jgi:hypothetical protein
MSATEFPDSIASRFGRKVTRAKLRALERADQKNAKGQHSILENQGPRRTVTSGTRYTFMDDQGRSYCSLRSPANLQLRNHVMQSYFSDFLAEAPMCELFIVRRPRKHLVATPPTIGSVFYSRRGLKAYKVVAIRCNSDPKMAYAYVVAREAVD